jgi:hypothetical protein
MSQGKPAGPLTASIREFDTIGSLAVHARMPQLFIHD